MGYYWSIMKQYPMYPVGNHFMNQIGFKGSKFIANIENAGSYYSRQPFARQADSIVHIYEVKQGSCCSQQLEAIVEIVPYLLRDFSLLEYKQAYYIVAKTLEVSFGLLQAYPEGFFLDDRMIGFTKEGFLRVWFHSDFTASHPEQPIVEIAPKKYSSCWYISYSDQIKLRLDSLESYNTKMGMLADRVVDVVGRHCRGGGTDWLSEKVGEYVHIWQKSQLFSQEKEERKKKFIEGRDLGMAHLNMDRLLRENYLRK